MARFLPPALAMTIFLISAASTRPAAAGEGTPLLLDVIVNGYDTRKIGEFVQRDGDILVKPSELHDLGFRVPKSLRPGPDGRIALATLPRTTYRVENATQTLRVTAPNELFRPTLLRITSIAGARTPVESGMGATLNYDVLAEKTDGDAFVNGDFDLRGFSPWGTASSGVLLSRAPAGSYTATRLDSTYTFSDPDSLRRYRLGDFINGGLAWTRPVRLAGAQASADFALRPDLVTIPLPAVSGTTAVPSTVDVLVNGVRVFTRQVKPGPFEAPQIPVVSGASDVSVAVTNATGRQVIATLPFYTGGGLLAHGLQSFSVEAGAVRRNFGLLSNDYDGFAASGTWRRGLFSNIFTAEAHAEAGDGLFMAGGGGLLNIANLGILNLDAAASTESGRTGALGSIGFLRLAYPFSFSAKETLAQRSFKDIAAENSDPFPTRQLNAGIGLDLRHLGSLGVSYNRIDRPSFRAPAPLVSSSLPGEPVFLQPAQHAELASASYTVQLGSLSLTVNGFHDLAGGSTGALISLTIPLGPRSSASTSVITGSTGSYGEARASQSINEIGDFGYRVSAAEGAQSREFAEVGYKSPWATLFAGADRTEGRTAGRLEAQGAVSYLDGGLFPTNPVNDSFAVVDTGIPNVGVLRENRRAGKTDSNGRFLVPDLRAFDVNHLAIDPTDIPADDSLSTAARDIRPQDRSGVVVKFPIRPSHGALVRLTDENGAAIPVGSTATLRATKSTVPIGYDGDAYLQDLNARNELAVEEPNGKRCTAVFTYRPAPGNIPTIGPVICREQRP